MEIIPIILVSLVGVFLVSILISMFSKRARSKLMSNNIKAMKHMVDETKDDIKEMSTDIANATKEAVEIEAEAKARGIKKGLTE